MIAGGVAALALVVAFALSYKSWRLQDDPALSPDTLDDYREAARQGNPAVGVKLVGAYTEIARGRRKNNESRAESLEHAAIACVAAGIFIAIELGLAFVAVGVQ